MYALLTIDLTTCTVPALIGHSELKMVRTFVDNQIHVHVYVKVGNTPSSKCMWEF